MCSPTVPGRTSVRLLIGCGIKRNPRYGDLLQQPLASQAVPILFHCPPRVVTLAPLVSPTSSLCQRDRAEDVAAGAGWHIVGHVYRTYVWRVAEVTMTSPSHTEAHSCRYTLLMLCQPFTTLTMCLRSPQPRLSVCHMPVACLYRPSLGDASGVISSWSFSVCRMTVNATRTPTCSSVNSRCKSSMPAIVWVP
jgi:hypothetical protein